MEKVKRCRTVTMKDVCDMSGITPQQFRRRFGSWKKFLVSIGEREQRVKVIRKVMKLVDERKGLMECKVCGWQKIANKHAGGRYERGSWQCPHGCEKKGTISFCNKPWFIKKSQT